MPDFWQEMLSAASLYIPPAEFLKHAAFVCLLIGTIAACYMFKCQCKGLAHLFQELLYDGGSRPRMLCFRSLDVVYCLVLTFVLCMLIHGVHRAKWMKGFKAPKI